MSIEINQENINAFLHFGWLPRLDIDPPFPEEWVPSEAKNDNPSSIEGANILREAVSRHVPQGTSVVVPLSGGFDSRAMLAILHEQGRDITAVTLGVPGTYDYEIGRLVAKKMGIRHEAININEIPLTTAELVSYAKKTGDWTNIIETFYSLLIATKNSAPIVSGFLGDFLAGSYSKYSFPAWKDTQVQFCKDNKVSREITLTSPEYDPTTALFIQPKEFALTNYEELVYRTRHTCSLRPTAFETDFNYAVPFRDEEWVSFILNCPAEFRHGQNFYQKILAENWPDFFNLPSKNYKGATINSSDLKKKLLSQKARVRNKISRTWPQISHSLLGVDPMLNYTDFNNQIVCNRNLRDVFIENLSDLEIRNCTPWLDLKTLNKKLNNTKKLSYYEGIMLLTLVNLEINLKASST